MKSGESATARSALDKGTSAHARARGSSAAGPGAKRCSPGGEGERNREAAAGPECDNANAAEDGGGPVPGPWSPRAAEQMAQR